MRKRACVNRLSREKKKKKKNEERALEGELYFSEFESDTLSMYIRSNVFSKKDRGIHLITNNSIEWHTQQEF